MDGDGWSKCEVKRLDERDLATSLNGEIDFGSGFIVNGFYGKASADSQSESGYTTPKKRGAGRSNLKDIEMDKEVQGGLMETLSQEEASGNVIDSRPELHVDINHTGLQDETFIIKKSDDKIIKNKLSSKEDSWTLFKPPPAFPVDNSSAKIVPKISYASKVKENLNKAGQEVPQVGVRLNQVPMSALKTGTSVNFSNGIPSAFNSAASVSLSDPGDEDVASDLASSRSFSAPVSEPRKSQESLFVYPHKVLNMQTTPPCGAPGNQALGDIFQNQWGLSFINEPNTDPEKSGFFTRPVVSEISVEDITFQGESLPHLPQPHVSLPRHEKVEEPLNSHTATEDHPHAQPITLDDQNNAISEVSCKDLATPTLTSGVTGSAGPSKTQNHIKSPGEVTSWGLFDLQAAVLYHTKEFEYLVTLRKQDPNRVVCYEESLDGPDH